MKKTKKLLVSLLCMLSVGFSTLALGACEETVNNNSTQSSSSSTQSTENGETQNNTEQSSIEQVYTQYVAYMNTQGQTPLSYDEWLNSIKGQDGRGIASVVRDIEGNFLIVFTDGTTQTVAMPEMQNHVHTFESWISFTQENVPCEERIFYHACQECGIMEWKKGTYAEHAWEVETVSPTCQAQGYDVKTCVTCGEVEITNYTDIIECIWEVETIAPTCQAQGYDEKICTMCGEVKYENYTDIIPHDWEEKHRYDNSFHWIKCENCEEIKEIAEHTIDETGFCSTCTAPLAPSEGLSYGISADGTYYEIIGYNGEAKNIVCGGEYNNLPVKSVCGGAFYGLDITAVTFLDSIYSIGVQAFYDCENLTSVTFGKGVTDIGQEAFSLCKNLKNVHITDIAAWCNIDFECGIYADNLYLNNELVTELVIPDSVTSIGAYAFFFDCITTVKIPASVTSVSSAFSSLTNLYYMGDLESWLNIKLNSPWYGVDNLYINNALVTEVVIPDSVTSIGEDAFYGYKNLTSVVIGDGVESIGEDAFYGCTGLTSIEIPDSVTSIGWGAFRDCTRLNNIEIPDSVESIGAAAFSGCTGLTSVVIGDGVESIGGAAFSGCTGLTNIEIPDSVESIGDSAFYGCTNLTSIEIPDSVESIGSQAFEGCDKLTYNVYGNAKYLGNENNPYCVLICAVSNTYVRYDIHENTKIIADSAFSGCTFIEEIEIPYGVTSIGYGAFRDCTRLNNIEIPDSVTRIGGWAFYGTGYANNDVNWEYDSGYWSNRILYIEEYLLDADYNISRGQVKDGTIFIADSAFQGSHSLASVIIPDSVTSIGENAFAYCDRLTRVYYKGNAEDWGVIAIADGNSDLTSATRYYYIENEEDVPTDGSNYWHYNESGEIEVWANNS